MKKRIVKKYVNRYINSVIKDLPRVDTWMQREVKEIDGLRLVTVHANNHTIANGEYKPEGTISNGCVNLLKNIKLTGLKAKEIISTHKHVYFRLFEISGNQVRMRIITE